MKTTFFWNWKMVLALAAVPLVVAGLEGLARSTSADAAQAPAPAPPAIQLAAATDVPLDPPAPNSMTAQVPGPAPAAAVNLSPGADQVVSLAEAGTGEDVMLAFVKASANRFNLGSDEIVYLNDLGVPGSVIKEMIEHDALLGMAVTNTPPPVLTSANPPPPPEAAPAYAPNYTDYNANDNYNPDAGADYFYNSLAPYGTWVDISGYGRCWQPTVYLVDHSWQPYGARGRWLDTDYGWYWQSDYSWGWAAFHYGRWFQDLRHGWLWQPDLAWGPAWVSWRNSADYCGWAPLPPGAYFRAGSGWVFGNRLVGVNFDFGLGVSSFTFVPLSHFGDAAPWRYRVTPGQAGRIYGVTRVNNNVTIQNNVVVNHGIDRNRVAAVTPGGIRQAEVRDLPAGGALAARPDRVQRAGDRDVVFRPQLQMPGGRRSGPPASAAPAATPAVRPSVRPGSNPFAPVQADDTSRGTPSASATPVTTISRPRGNGPPNSDSTVRSFYSRPPATPARSVNDPGTVPAAPVSPAQPQNIIPSRNSPATPSPAYPATPAGPGSTPGRASRDNYTPPAASSFAPSTPSARSSPGYSPQPASPYSGRTQPSSSPPPAVTAQPAYRAPAAEPRYAPAASASPAPSTPSTPTSPSAQSTPGTASSSGSASSQRGGSSQR